MDVGPSLPERVLADAGRLRQVLTNLAGNAVKFTDTGHVLLRVRAAPGAAPSSGTVGLRFEVEDTGCGVPPEQLGHMFEKFEQSTLTGGTREGTGLGLAITKGLVELMGGRVGAQSEVGRGLALLVRGRPAGGRGRPRLRAAPARPRGRAPARRGRQRREPRRAARAGGGVGGRRGGRGRRRGGAEGAAGRARSWRALRRAADGRAHAGDGRRGARAGRARRPGARGPARRGAGLDRRGAERRRRPGRRPPRPSTSGSPSPCAPDRCARRWPGASTGVGEGPRRSTPGPTLCRTRRPAPRSHRRARSRTGRAARRGRTAPARS